MNDNNKLDRFYIDTKKSKEIHAQIYKDHPPQELTFLEYCPEPIHLTEAKGKGLKFTCGKKYPVLEKKYGHILDSNYSFKTKDDNDKEIWIDEKYFVPEENLVWWGIDKSDLPDINFGSKRVESCTIDKFEEIQDRFQNAIKNNEISDESAYLFKTLAGVNSTCSAPNSPQQKKIAEIVVTIDEQRKSPFWKPEVIKDIHEGVVKDSGNELMNNIDKCVAAMENVFGGYSLVDPDNIIFNIKKYWLLKYSQPKRDIAWINGILAVDGAKTNIRYENTKKACIGLSKVTTTKMAERTVARLIVRKLKKLF